MPPKPPSPLLPKNRAVQQSTLLSPQLARRSSSSSSSSTAPTPASRKQHPSDRFPSSLNPSPSPFLPKSPQPTLPSPSPPTSLKTFTTMSTPPSFSSSSSKPPSSIPPPPPTPQPSSKSALRAHFRNYILPSLPEEQISSQSHRAQTTILQDLPAWKTAERVSIYLSMPSGEARTEELVRMALEAGKGVFVPVLCRERCEEEGGRWETDEAKREGGDAGGSGGKLEESGGSGAGAPGVGDTGTGRLEQKPKPKKKKRKMRMEMLRLHSLEEFELLERDSWGIPSLPPPSLAGRENARGGVGPEGRISRPGEEEEEEGEEGKGKGENGNEGAEEKGGGLDLVVVPGVAFDREMARMGHGAGFYDRYLTRLVTEGRHRKPFLVGLCLAEQVLEPGRILMEDWDWRVDAVATGGGRLLTVDGVASGGD